MVENTYVALAAYSSRSDSSLSSSGVLRRPGRLACNDVRILRGFDDFRDERD